MCSQELASILKLFILLHSFWAMKSTLPYHPLDGLELKMLQKTRIISVSDRNVIHLKANIFLAVGSTDLQHVGFPFGHFTGGKIFFPCEKCTRRPTRGRCLGRAGATPARWLRPKGHG